MKYLGVVFQRMGRTNRHVDYNARNASRALNVIKVLRTQPWANPPKVLVSLVRSLVRSRLVYGLEAMPSITETGLKRLTAIEAGLCDWPSGYRSPCLTAWCTGMPGCYH